MDLYDIVAPFLSTSDLAAAALVCKSWNISFTPFLYFSIEWSDLNIGKRLDQDAVLRNASHIRHLGIFTDPPTMFSTHCTRLQSLNIGIGGWLGEVDNLFCMATLVENNPAITSITLNGMNGARYDDQDQDTSFNTFLMILLSCSGLRTLHITSFGLDRASMDSIFDTAVRLERLTLLGSGDAVMSLEKWPCFPALKELKIDLKTPSHNQIEVIRRCPQLRVLDWYPPKDEEISIADVADVFKTHCPLIEELTLVIWSWSDQDISEILDNCGQLTSFTLVFVGSWTPLSLDRTSVSLSRHFSSLRKLEVPITELPNNTMQDIMANCPNLRSLKGGRLMASDILDISKDKQVMDQAASLQQPHPQDWICTNLQHLEVFIGGLEDKPLEWHQRVFEQLSRLTRLEKLHIGGILSYKEDRGGLDLRLEAGLGALKSLRQLQELRFGGLWQEMSEGDVKWMLDTWPRLREVDGKVHHDRHERFKLRGILSQAGVQVPVFDEDNAVLTAA
ncbi:hypothetical protein B0O80DRAFT_135149 [Mortierella sp. GBAus27b]|nr:hypothetical protein B0O80DRAFT_135149 [Mortierella sp. GBAus27b]